MNKEDFVIDEIHHARKRLEIHESRRYQMLVLSVVGFSTVLGFSSKVSPEILPFIILLLLILTSSIYFSESNIQYFCSAFLLEVYAKNKNLPFFDEAFHSSHALSKQQSSHLSQIFRTIFRVVLEPFFLFSIAGVSATIYFSQNYLTKLWDNQNLGLLVVYLIPLVLGYLYIFIRSIHKQRIGNKSFREVCEAYLDSKVDIELKFPKK